MKWMFYEKTHKGGRDYNQDYFAHCMGDEWACSVIADGLGGHERGEVAAQEFCKEICQQVKSIARQMRVEPIAAMEQLIANSAEAMRHNIIKKHGHIDTHTTFALVWLDSQHMVTAHVGDSRIYRLNPNQILWRTPDHTVVQELYEKDLVSEEEFASHPLQNRLLRTLNLYAPPEADIFLHPALDKNETVVLCTDGFWTHLRSQDWLKLARAKKFKKEVDLIFKDILIHHPAADNITVQLIRSQ